MKTTAVYQVHCDDEELTIFPKKGKILGDQKSHFTISFFSAEPKEFNTEIVVNIRGGKQLRLPVRAVSIVPELEILEAGADFGGVTQGDQRIMPLTIMNSSDITGKIELDIRDHPEFEIIFSGLQGVHS